MVWYDIGECTSIVSVLLSEIHLCALSAIIDESPPHMHCALCIEGGIIYEYAAQSTMSVRITSQRHSIILKDIINPRPLFVL